MHLPDLPMYEPEAEDEAEPIGDGPPTILITGACGNIGRKLREAWDDAADLILIDAAGHDDPEILVADLSTWDEAWASAFDGVDAVIHLAANPSEFTPWDQLVGPNLDALNNVFLAAAIAGVERLIYASSNHAMGGYRALEGPITEDLPPRPGNDYGAAKLAGERLGKSLAEAFGMSVVALRIGWVQPGENRPDTLPDDWSRSIWLSNRDMLQLFQAAVEAPLSGGDFVLVNGLSNNKGTRWSLARAAEKLGYIPEDDAYAGGPD